MPERVQVYECSTPLGLATLAQVVEEEGFDAARRRILLVSINGRYPEVDDWFRGSPRLRKLASETFDEVVSLNELVWPSHPSEWQWQGSWSGHRRVWLRCLGVERVDELILESIQAPPALSLARLFSEATIRVYSDGLMAYSPTRIPLPGGVLDRVDVVHCVDYLEGVEPLLLQEASPCVDFIEPALVVERMASEDEPAPKTRGKSTVLVLGQSLAAHGILDEEQEVELYSSVLVSLADVFSPASLRFKAHPTVSGAITDAVERSFAASTGQPLEVVGGMAPLEEVVGQIDPASVVGFFSTGLVTVRRHFDIPVFQARAEELFQSLSPYENSNRIPALIAALALPSVERLLVAGRDEGERVSPATAARRAAQEFRVDRQLLEEAIVAVGVRMQPVTLAHRVSDADRIARGPNGAKIEPFMTCADERGTASEAIRVFSAQGIRRAALRATDTVVAGLLPPRLSSKFERDPRGFFSDSRNEWIRRLGLVYEGLLLDEDEDER